MRISSLLKVIMGTILVSGCAAPERSAQQGRQQSTRFQKEKAVVDQPAQPATPKPSSPRPTEPAAEVARPEKESATWEHALRINTQEGYEDFLQQYPDSPLAPQGLWNAEQAALRDIRSKGLGSRFVIKEITPDPQCEPGGLVKVKGEGDSVIVELTIDPTDRHLRAHPSVLTIAPVKPGKPMEFPRSLPSLGIGFWGAGAIHRYEGRVKAERQILERIESVSLEH